MNLRTDTEWLAYTITRADQANKLERRLTRWKIACCIAVIGQAALFTALLIG